MSGSVVKKWARTDDYVSYRDLTEALEQVHADLDIEEAPSPPSHRIYSENVIGRSGIYDFLLASDAPRRVRQSTDTRAAIEAVVEEVIAILEPGLREPIEPPNRAAIHAEIVGRFRGNVDLGRLETEPVDPSAGLDTSPPDEPKTIAVDRLTERNTVDRSIFHVDSVADLFGASWGNLTAMFHRLQASTLEPEVTVSDLALNWAVDGVHLAAKHTAPETPIATIEPLRHQRSLVTRVPDPAGTFGREYGDTDAMKTTLRENETASERVWSGRIDSVLTPGLQW